MRKLNINVKRINELVDEGWIIRKKHPTADLWIYNYSAKAEYANYWPEEVQICRGLILDGAGNVVALPFKKFFNWGQQTTDVLLIEATVKFDGSCGILYRLDGDYHIATRGSFDSEQAVWATNFLRKHHPKLEGLSDELTLIFEIVYPANRIVVDYQGLEELILIGVRNRFTGRDLWAGDIQYVGAKFGFQTLVTYDFDTVEDALKLAAAIEANQEGWVLRFEDGQRFKVKGDQYKLAHKLMTGVSFNRVLEAMEAGTLQGWLEGVPDEFLGTIKQYQQEIADATVAILNRIADQMGSAPKSNRKDFALWVQANCKADAAYMFAALDEHDLVPLIYRNAFKNKAQSSE